MRARLHKIDKYAKRYRLRRLLLKCLLRIVRIVLYIVTAARQTSALGTSPVSYTHLVGYPETMRLFTLYRTTGTQSSSYRLLFFLEICISLR